MYFYPYKNRRKRKTNQIISLIPYFEFYDFSHGQNKIKPAFFAVQQHMIIGSKEMTISKV